MAWDYANRALIMFTFFMMVFGAFALVGGVITFGLATFTSVTWPGLAFYCMATIGAALGVVVAIRVPTIKEHDQVQARVLSQRPRAKQ